jgi:ribosomal protein L21E
MRSYRFAGGVLVQERKRYRENNTLRQFFQIFRYNRAIVIVINGAVVDLY